MIKSIVNPLGKSYVKSNLKKRGNPFELFKKLKQNTELPLADKGVIFIGSIRMSVEAHLFEGLLGYAYRLKGYKVYALMCGQKLSICESLPHGKSFSDLKCVTCYAQQKLFCEAFDLTPLYFGDFINETDEQEISEGVKSLAFDQMNYLGQDLTSHISSGIMRVLKKSELNENDNGLIKKFGKSALYSLTATRNMIKKFQPKHLILSHGTYSTWGGMVLGANLDDVHTVVWGRGYVGKGNVYATHDGSYLRNNILEPMSNFDDIIIDKRKKALIDAYFEGKRNPNSKVDYVSYYDFKKEIDTSVDVLKSLDIPKEKRVVGMFPNIPWDGQAFSYSEGFPSIRTFIKSTVEWFKNREEILVIRAHPAELHTRSEGQFETFEDILTELFPTLPENVIFLEPSHTITSYQLEAVITGALLYGGTLGLEFALNDTAVIQTGKNALSNKGFIFEPQNIEEYTALLEKVAKGDLKMTEEMTQNSKRFAYHWIFRRHFPETLINFDGPLQFKGFLFKSADELLENEELGQFMSCIEERKDFIYHPVDDK